MKMFLTVEALSENWLSDGWIENKLRGIDRNIEVVPAHSGGGFVDIFRQVAESEEYLVQSVDVQKDKRDCGAACVFFVSQTSFSRLQRSSVPQHVLLYCVKDGVIQSLYGRPSNQKKKTLIADLEKDYAQARKLITFLITEFSSHDRKTTLLLPPNLLSTTPAAAFYALLDDCSPLTSESAKRVRRLFASSAGISVREESKSTKFVCRRKLEISPCRRDGSRHGLPNIPPTDDHLNSCSLNAIFRFGAPFNFRFHYDVTDKNGSYIRRLNLPDCHGAKALRDGNPHINIYPNGYIR